MTTANQDENTVTLDTPIKRGEQIIEKITLRKPTSGELRGTSLADLCNLDVDALQKVLPRIASPMLTEQDVARLDPADLVQLGGKFASFFLPKALQASTESLSE
ncbi:MAG: phage tail assembly protein [bacterium]|nr:phage tail assembly protein [bacterium]